MGFGPATVDFQGALAGFDGLLDFTIGLQGSGPGQPDFPEVSPARAGHFLEQVLNRRMIVSEKETLRSFEQGLDSLR